MMIAANGAEEVYTPSPAAGASPIRPILNGGRHLAGGPCFSVAGLPGWPTGKFAHPIGNLNSVPAQMLVVSLRTHVWSLDSTGLILSGDSISNHFGRQQ